MRWYVLAFGAPLADNKPVQRHSPDVVDMAMEDPRGLPIVPSPWPRPGKNYEKKTKKTRRSLKRRPLPDLYRGPKTPIDGTGWPRPSGDGAT